MVHPLGGIVGLDHRQKCDQGRGVDRQLVSEHIEGDTVSRSMAPGMLRRSLPLAGSTATLASLAAQQPTGRRACVGWTASTDGAGGVPP